MKNFFPVMAVLVCGLQQSVHEQVEHGFFRSASGLAAMASPSNNCGNRRAATK